MARRWFLYPFLIALSVGLSSPGLAQEKVKLGTTTKIGVIEFLPVLTAERQGFWKENGLEVEWVPMTGGAPLMRAAAAGAISTGLVGSENPMIAAEKGVPVILVAEYISEYPFFVWVRADSPSRHVRDLKGRRIGVTTLGGTTHAYARIIAKAQGMEKDVRFVGAGSVPAVIAGFRAGAFDAMITAMSVVVKLKVGGAIREVASTADYLPKPWVHYTIFARKDFARSKPEALRKVIKATLQATDFIKKNTPWAMDLMKSFGGLSEQEAKVVYEVIQLNITGKMERAGVENARRLYMEYGILTDKAPAVDELFTNQYLPG